MTDIEQCELELAALYNGDGYEGDCRAWLWLLGYADWHKEKYLSEKEHLRQTFVPPSSKH